MTPNKTNKFTEAKEFKPTPAMVVWLEASINLLTTNIKEISSECKVTRQSWYSWMKQDGFVEWFDEEWQKRLRRIKWKLDVIGFQKAESDYRYWEGMVNRLGMMNKDQEDKDIKITIQDYAITRGEEVVGRVKG